MFPPRDPVRRSSDALVLDHAFRSGAFTATDVITATGLTRSTVLTACDELVALGWIVELVDARAAGEYRLGRPARRYELRALAGVVVGVDVGHHRVTAHVASLRGVVLGRHEWTLDGGQDADERRDATARCVAAALEDAAVAPERVLVAAVGVPSPVDARGGSPAEDDGFWHTMNPGFDGLLDPATRVVIENDANLAAVAERAAGAGDSFAALLAGERFGTGLIVDGMLLRGARGGAGELRVLGLVEGVGTPEGLGSAARRLVAEAVADGRARPGSPLAVAAAAGEVEARELFAAATAGDPVAAEVVEALAVRLARTCIVLGSVLDIRRVYVEGAIAVPAAALIRRADTILREGPYHPVPEVLPSRLGVDVVVLGAVERALETVRADPLGFAVS